VLLLAFACFAPWTEVTTFRGESIVVGAMNEYSGGAQLVLLCAAGAALGLLVRARWLTRTCAIAAAVLSVVVMYQSPGTMLQLGYEAHATWGGFLAFASSVSLLALTRARASTPVPLRSFEPR
jgi:hypothetical protein